MPASGWESRLLEGRTYVPLIYLRQSEMQALEKLPGATKNNHRTPYQGETLARIKKPDPGG
jgi:hypothetical protein